MRLTLPQLTAHLQRQLASFYFIFGDEPLLIDEARQSICRHAQTKGFLESEFFYTDTHFDWQNLSDSARTLSLFHEKLLLLIQHKDNKFSDTAKIILPELVENPPVDRVIIVSCGKLDNSVAKAKWFKTLERDGVVIQVRPIQLNALPQWIRQRLHDEGLKIAEEGIKLLIDCCEGNLLALKQELEKLNLLYPHQKITLKEVQEAISDSARFNLFELVDDVLLGEGNRVLRILRALSREGVEPLLILWALTREIRQLAIMKFQLEQGISETQVLQEHGVWQQRKPLIKQALKRHSSEKWRHLLKFAAQIDMTIKNNRKINYFNLLEQLAAGVVGNDIEINIG